MKKLFFITTLLFCSISFAQDYKKNNLFYIELKCKQFYADDNKRVGYGHESFIIKIDKDKNVGYLDWEGIRAELYNMTDQKYVFRNRVTSYVLNRITLEIESFSYRFECQEAQSI